MPVAPRIVNDVAYATITSSHPATNHIKTGHHITTMERLKTRSLKKPGLGIAVVGHPVHIL